MEITIRHEIPDDVSAIEAVTIAAFRDAPYASHTEQFIIRALRSAGALALSLIAEAEGTAAGHVAASPVSISDGALGWFGIGPVSVTPELLGRGIGSRLMHAALRILREQETAGCVVLGDPAYYTRFGFKPEPDLVLPDAPPECFLAISFGAQVPHGTVTYHAAFSAGE